LLGEYGPSVELYRGGDVPDLDQTVADWRWNSMPIKSLN
jgi:hypothetical protein